MTEALLLGSFDPPTIGHLHLISEALKVGVDCVRLIPAYNNPWKKHKASYKDRMKMVSLLEKAYPLGKLKVSNFEGRLIRDKYPERNYIPTYLLLREQKEYYYYKEIEIITTNETYLEIPKWEKGEEILRENKFLVFNTSHLGPKIPGGYDILDFPISSTLVRELLEEGIDCPEYLDRKVYKYIKENNLYS